MLVNRVCFGPIVREKDMRTSILTNQLFFIKTMRLLTEFGHVAVQTSLLWSHFGS